MPEEFRIIEVLPEQVLADEPMGTKDKFWIILPEDWDKWLFKYSRVNNGVATGEHWAEKIACEIAGELNISHAVVELASFDGRPGSLSRRFAQLSLPGTALAHGNALLAPLVFDYDPKKMFRQSSHTLGNILRVIDKMFIDPEDHTRALNDLMSYLVLDGLILNTDRHHENWALIRFTSESGRELGHRMAPTFDHASSMGRNVTPSQLQAWGARPADVARYARNAPGAMYGLPTDKAGLNPIELVRLALRMKPDHVRPWLLRLHTLDPDTLTEIVEQVPSEMMSPEQKAFTAALLRHTLGILQQLAS